jgi:hypothetical protein
MRFVEFRIEACSNVTNIHDFPWNLRLYQLSYIVREVEVAMRGRNALPSMFANFFPVQIQGKGPAGYIDLAYNTSDTIVQLAYLRNAVWVDWHGSASTAVCISEVNGIAVARHRPCRRKESKSNSQKIVSMQVIDL